jgi:hypothetical protein
MLCQSTTPSSFSVGSVAVTHASVGAMSTVRANTAYRDGGEDGEQEQRTSSEADAHSENYSRVGPAAVVRARVSGKTTGRLP